MGHANDRHDPDYNPYCLPKRYRNRLPREIIGGQPCMEEFNALFECLTASKFDKQPCEEMHKQRNPVKSSYKYHIYRMIKNKYRLPVYK